MNDMDLKLVRGYCMRDVVADGSDGSTIKKLTAAATNAGATVKIIARKVGNAKLADGSVLPVDGQLAGSPSVLFDAVAVIADNNYQSRSSCGLEIQ